MLRQRDDVIIADKNENLQESKAYLCAKFACSTPDGLGGTNKRALVYYRKMCKCSYRLCVFSRLVEDDSKATSKEPVDAAALIAEALKRKFAHRHRCDSEQGDGEDFKLPVSEVKPGNETPQVRNVAVL